MATVEEIKLSSGVLVKCRPVSPLAIGPVYRSIPEPDFPMVDVSSAAGGAEEHPALQGTEEYVEYQRKMRAYRGELGNAIMDFKLNYGIVAWSWDNGETWHQNPSDDWEVHPALKYWGVETPTNMYEKRVLYIRNELILCEADDDKIADVVGSKPGKSTAPITDEEIKAQLDPTD